MRNFFLTNYLAALSPVRRSYRSQRITLAIDQHTLPAVEQMAEFLREHSGKGHDVTVVHEPGAQILVCSCGGPDLHDLPVRRERTLLT